MIFAFWLCMILRISRKHAFAMCGCVVAVYMCVCVCGGGLGMNARAYIRMSVHFICYLSKSRRRIDPRSHGALGHQADQSFWYARAHNYSAPSVGLTSLDQHEKRLHKIRSLCGLWLSACAGTYVSAHCLKGCLAQSTAGPLRSTSLQKIQSLNLVS